MKNVFVICVMVFMSSLLYSQDIIHKKDGTKIEAEVLEVTQTLIKYKKFNQDGGPLRSINISDVESIVYESGEKEVFNNSKNTKKKKSKAVNNKNDIILKSGLFLDLLLGYGGVTRNQLFYDPYTGLITEGSNRKDYFVLTLQFGNKWYFGQREKWRPGFQATWFRYGISVIPDDPLGSLLAGPKNFSIVNVGMCNAFKISEETGFELNFTTGLNIEIDFYDDYFGGGLAFTPEFKYRYKNLAVGLNYSRIQSIEPNQFSNWNIFSLSVGAKF